MPKPSKTQPKNKSKLKNKTQQKPAGITTKKAYWITLLPILAVASVIIGFAQGLGLLQTAFLAASVVAVVGFVGFIRVNTSTLSFSKRATFIFVGASVIGFGIWAALVLEFMPQVKSLDAFSVAASLIICLVLGAFIGELLGRSRKVQERLFPQNI